MTRFGYSSSRTTPGTPDSSARFVRTRRLPAFTIETVDRLAEGLERLRAGGVDLILLNPGLPDSEPKNTFASMQAVASEIPVILLTRPMDEDLALGLVRGGTQDYLVKGRVDGPLLVRAARYAIERKHAQNRIRWLTVAMDQSPAAVMITDPAGTIEYVNEQFTRLTGYQAEEALGRKPSILKSGLTSLTPEALARKVREVLDSA